MGAQCFTDLKLMMMVLRYHLCTISATFAALTCVVKLMSFGEIVINPSDLKHIVEPLGYSDGLGVVIPTRSHLWDAF